MAVVSHRLLLGMMIAVVSGFVVPGPRTPPKHRLVRREVGGSELPRRLAGFLGKRLGKKTQLSQSMPVMAMIPMAAVVLRESPQPLYMEYLGWVAWFFKGFFGWLKEILMGWDWLFWAEFVLMTFVIGGWLGGSGIVGFIKQITMYKEYKKERLTLDSLAVSTKEAQTATFKTMHCKNCGNTMYPARARFKWFFKHGIKCNNCGAEPPMFYNQNDVTDIINFTPIPIKYLDVDGNWNSTIGNPRPEPEDLLLEKLDEAKNIYDPAVARLNAARDQLDEANKNGSANKIKDAMANLELAQYRFDAAQNLLNKAQFNLNHFYDLFEYEDDDDDDDDISGPQVPPDDDYVAASSQDDRPVASPSDPSVASTGGPASVVVHAEEEIDYVQDTTDAVKDDVVQDTTDVDLRDDVQDTTDDTNVHLEDPAIDETLAAAPDDDEQKSKEKGTEKVPSKLKIFQEIGVL